MSSIQKLAGGIILGTILITAILAGVWSTLLIFQSPGDSPEIVLQLDHLTKVTSVAWSPNGKALATATEDHQIEVWDTSSSRLRCVLSGHSDWVSSVAWSPDGKTLASASLDNTAKFWDLSICQLLRTVNGPSNGDHGTKGNSSLVWRVTSVALSPNGKILASAAEASNPVFPAGLTDGQVNAHADRGVKLWDAADGHLLRTLGIGSSEVSSLAWSPDGKILASANFNHTVKLWDIVNGQLMRTLNGPVYSLAWSPDGRTLAGVSRDETVRLWDSTTGQLLGTIDDNSNFVVWSPDGSALASANLGSTIRIWDVATRRLLHTLTGDFRGLYSVAWNPDGDTLASGTGDSSVTIWSAASGHALAKTFVLPQSEWLMIKPGFLRYAASRQGDDYAVIRFGRQPPVYPLSYYRKELRVANLEPEPSPLPDIKPKPIRLTWDNWHNRARWIGGFAVVYCMGLAATLSLVRRSDPARIARQFFARAGFDKVEFLDQHRLRLTSKRDRLSAEAIIWDSNYSSKWLPELEVRTYFVYKGQFLPGGAMQTLRARKRREVIPLQSATMARAISDNDCGSKLRELEEPFVIRTDPYDESRPITDPVWFYGRADLLAILPAVLRQHQHAGVFGLRKVGKTSLLNQLRTQIASSCVVGIDCHGYSPAASDLLHAILSEFHKEMLVQGIKNIPSMLMGRVSNFRTNFLQLYEIWIQSGKQGPFILLLDEVDKLFPDRSMTNSEKILGEWVLLFRILRALAQEKRCLALLVTAYRPHINRQNLLSPAIGENPMFMAFQEYFLGALSRADTEKMVGEIGAWKDIRWSPGALNKIYDLCGGHPQVTRFFASDACLQGNRKEIEEATVTETAQTIRADFRKHRIGDYYRESIWNRLQTDEQDALRLISANGSPGKMQALEEAVTNLGHLGIIRNDEGSPKIAAELFRYWLERS